jgi:FkbM family methyltransferase
MLVFLTALKRNKRKITESFRNKPYDVGWDFYKYFWLNLGKVSYIVDTSAKYNMDSEFQYLLTLWYITPLLASYPNLIYQNSTHYEDFQKLYGILKQNRHLPQGDESPYSNVEQQYLPSYVKLNEGDYVIDGGAFDGDTAAIFSGKVKSNGKVFAFEPTPENYEKIVARKLPNVVAEKKGLFSTSTVLKFRNIENMTAGNLIDANGETSIKVTSIDEYVKEHRIDRLNYIKLDIEGAELECLKGAAKTIRRFKPTMAICIYHNMGRDLIDVSSYLFQNYSDIYDFKIGLHSPAWAETVLYLIGK